MKFNFKIVLLSMLLLATFSASALAPQDLDFQEPSTIVLWLTPVITLGATWLLKKIAPFVTGIVTLMVVPLIAIGITWLTSIFTGDASWTAQTLAGVGAVFLHQISLYFNKE